MVEGPANTWTDGTMTISGNPTDGWNATNSTETWPTQMGPCPPTGDWGSGSFGNIFDLECADGMRGMPFGSSSSSAEPLLKSAQPISTPVFSSGLSSSSSMPLREVILPATGLGCKGCRRAK